MKAILLILCIPMLVCSSFFAKAQSGLNGISYQAIARTTNNNVIKLQAIQVKFSILAGGPDGNPVYVEKHQTTTSTQGLFTLTIGQGVSELGSWNNIPWSNANQYLKVELDMNGTNDFVSIGVMPFMAVPYALYAANGGSGSGPGGGTNVNIEWLGTRTTPPVAPTPGQAYYNSTDKRAYIYDSNKTAQILSQDGIPGQGVSWLGAFTTEPVSPGLNQAYYNMTDRKSYIYDGSAWQLFAESGGTGTGIIWKGTLTAAPASPAENWAYYNSTDRKAYVYDASGNWQILAQDGTGWNLSKLEYLGNGTLGLMTTANGDTLKTSSRAWLIRGNSDTNPALDFIGTTDDNPFIIKAGGTAPTFERMRVFPDKPSIIINGTDDPGQKNTNKGVLTVFSGDFDKGAITKDVNYSNGVVGLAQSGTGAGIAGFNASTGPGVKGYSEVGTAIYGYATTRFNEGVRGYNISTNGGTGTIGMTNSPFQATTGTRSSGVLGISTHSTGVGVLGAGNSVDITSADGDNVPRIGAGLLGVGLRVGSIGYATADANGIGLMGVGNHQTATQLPVSAGAGVYGVAGGQGTPATPGLAIFGWAKANAGDVNRWGGAFQIGSAPAATSNLAPPTPTTLVYTYLAGADATGSLYGLISNGTKSTVVKDETGDNRLLFCTEAPEVLFQDFGTGELTNGSAHIDLEGLLTKVIRVDAKHPMKVFIQLEGECNGVYVTNKSAKGFDVKELQGGKSNVPFTWQIVASRADEVLADGTVARYSDRRFPVGPGPVQMEEVVPADAAAPKSTLKPVVLKTKEKEVINKAFSNLQFASAKAEIAKSSLSSLDKMAALLQANPEWQLLLSGHTDNEGTEAFNQTLSEKRSDAVKEYLVSKGITASRITTKGYGQTKPLAANDSKLAKGKNRRVEMEILTEEKP